MVRPGLCVGLPAALNKSCMPSLSWLILTYTFVIQKDTVIIAVIGIITLCIISDKSLTNSCSAVRCTIIPHIRSSFKNDGNFLYIVSKTVCKKLSL